MFFLLLHTFGICNAMYGSSSRTLFDEPAAKRLRSNIADLYLSNKISARESVSLCNDAQLQKTDLESLHDVCVGDSHSKNSNRDLTRRLFKDNDWPDVYMCKIPCSLYDSDDAVEMEVPFLLPHEILDFLATKLDVLSTTFMSKECKLHLKKCKQKLGVSAATGLGLWIDGVPFTHDRKESLEVFSLSLPGVDAIRVPICAVPKKWFVKDKTYDAILKVIAWSLEQAAVGKLASRDHENKPLSSKRMGRAGNKCARGVLVQVRGDWSCYKSVFRLPGWRDKGGICFKCNCTLDDIANCNMSAPWRKPQNRYTHWELVNRLLTEGKKLSPLFSVPFFEASIIEIDWLHSADLGVTLDTLGSVFHMLLPNFGATQAQQCKALHKQMLDFYKRNGRSDDRIDRLTYLMIMPENKPTAKLRAKAGEARHLVPFALELVTKFAVDGTPPEYKAAKHCLKSLNDCYCCLSDENYDANKLANAAREFALQYSALHDLASANSIKRWGLKPKFHMFLEMCTFSKSSPAKAWTYRDESFGGYIADIARSRGGPSNPRTVGLQVLNKFRISAKFRD